MSSSQRFGFFVGLTAYFIWGSLPLYIRAMRHVLPQELLAHRVIWSVPTAVVLIALAGNWRGQRGCGTVVLLIIDLGWAEGFH